MFQKREHTQNSREDLRELQAFGSLRQGAGEVEEPSAQFKEINYQHHHQKVNTRHKPSPLIYLPNSNKKKSRKC
jgi:hypothetical protein